MSGSFEVAGDLPAEDGAFELVALLREAEGNIVLKVSQTAQMREGWTEHVGARRKVYYKTE